MTDAPTEPELVTLPEQSTAVVRGTVPLAELRDFYDRAFGLLPDVLAAQGIQISSAAFGCYQGPPTDVANLEVGFAIATAVEPDGDVVPSSLPGGRVARLVHHGSFEGLGESWGRLDAWVAEQGLTPGSPMWEVYLTEPSPDMDPADLRTELHLPIEG